MEKLPLSIKRFTSPYSKEAMVDALNLRALSVTLLKQFVYMSAGGDLELWSTLFGETWMRIDTYGHWTIGTHQPKFYALELLGEL